jgi:FtsP/CotA-like multicopper oxidase with cupredoxin domain
MHSRIRAEMNTNCYAASNDVLNPDVRAILTYINTTTAPGDSSQDWLDAYDVVCQDLNNTMLSPVVAQQAPPANVLYEIQFSFLIGDYQLSRPFINGTQWIPDYNDPTLNQAIAGLSAGNISTTAAGVVSGDFTANQFMISLPEVQVVDFIVMNFDDGSHPFHLHGHVFQVMATSPDQYFPWDTDLYSLINSTEANEYTKNPMRRDTITLPAYSWALLRFVNDVPGLHAFHW